MKIMNVGSRKIGTEEPAVKDTGLINHRQYGILMIFRLKFLFSKRELSNSYHERRDTKSVSLKTGVLKQLNNRQIPPKKFSNYT